MKSQLKKIGKKTLDKLKYVKVRGKVNLFIVGEQKCGTSSLHEYLIHSKNIVQGKRKEMHFFDSPLFDTKDYAYYEDSFKSLRSNRDIKYKIDSTPSYAWAESSLERIHAYNPNAKLIYITRDPVERFFSAYSFYKKKVNPNNTRLKNEKMKQFLVDNPNMSIQDFYNVEMSTSPVFHSLERGLYKQMISKILTYYPENQLLVLDFKDIVHTEQFKTTIKKIEQFLGLDLPQLELPHKNVTNSVGHKWPDAMVRTLTEFYSQQSK
ncbi:sulfotransferase domain-containing protein [bacterium]|nr:sulfotransferase domain-containing protein [bacterium]